MTNTRMGQHLGTKHRADSKRGWWAILGEGTYQAGLIVDRFCLTANGGHAHHDHRSHVL